MSNPSEGSGALLDAEGLGRAAAPEAARHKAFRSLHAVLVTFDAEAPLEARASQLEALGKWIRGRGKVPAVAGAGASDRPQILRVALLVRALEVAPAYRTRLARLLHTTLRDTNPLPLLARLGLPGDRGFLAETVDRLSGRLLPEPIDETNLTQLVARLFPKESDAVWLSALPDELVVRFAAVLSGGAGSTRAWGPLLPGVCHAMALIATRVSAVGLSEVIRVRSPAVPLRSSPFHVLPRATDALIAAVEDESPPPAELLAERVATCRAAAAACRSAVGAVVDNLERHGVSVDVVYRLELITKNLERLELLMDRAVEARDPEAPPRVRDVLVRLARARLSDRSLADIFGSNLHLLARKIIERAGHTGEHYITTSRAEYFKMLASAGGGGVLTAGTTALKYLIGWGHFAPFVEGLFSAMNYAGSFLVMQLLGFTLATKQPSMTAAALAGSLRDTAGHPDLSVLVSTIARITRSQLAAALGNLGMVIPAAMVLDLVYRRHFEKPFLDEATARYVLSSLHLTQSGTVFYAALTGVLLWISSVGAGWLENWATYRRLPEAISEHRLGRYVGRRTLGWVSRVFSRNISGVGGNTTLGILLGMTPVMGRFFGLPLDVRHVTLSTGALTLAVVSLGPTVMLGSDLGFAVAGIVVIGLMNFGVSFVLALAVALRAREVERSDRLRLLWSVTWTFARSPLQFFFPPREGVETVHGPASIRPPAP